MSTRRTNVISRSLGLLALVSLLVLPFTLLIGAPGKEIIGNSRGGSQIERGRPGGSHDERPVGAAQAELKFTDSMRRTFYTRPDVSGWWSDSTGKGLKGIGHVNYSELNDRDVIILPNSKGSFKAGHSTELDTLPSDMTAPPSQAGGRKALKGDLFIAQVSDSLISAKKSPDVRLELTKRGLEIIDFVPNNAFLVRASDAKGMATLKDPTVISNVIAYGAALKIHPAVGRQSLRDEDRAKSPMLHLVAKIVPGESMDDVKQTIERLGGNVVTDYNIAGRKSVSFDLLNNRLLELAKDGGILSIHEPRGFQQMNLTTSQMVEVGRLLDPRDFGGFLFPFRQAGIDGGGIISSGLPVYTTAAPGAALTLAAAVYDVQPQFLGVADNGLTLDGAQFANDNTHPCLSGTGACVDSGTATGLTGLGANHRKVEAYLQGTDYDATATGDFLTCDSISSGGNTHGTIAAGGAAGNPSGGPLGLGRLYSDEGNLDQYVVFFNDTRENNLELDGQARGARTIFMDIANTPPSSPPACAVSFLSDVDAGDNFAARIADMAFRHDLTPLATTVQPRGAKVTLFAFGTPINFDDDLTNGQGSYATGADDVDALLFANREILHVQAVGNDGADPVDNSDVDPTVSTGVGDVFDAADIQINDAATAKNIVTVGSNTSDTIQGTLDQSELIANFTSKGPATFGSQRGAPLVVAPGVDIGGGFEGREGRFSNDYFITMAQIVSFDNANDLVPFGGQIVEDVVIQGQAGTSVSAGKIAGAALQIRDYFAQGFYPTGTRTTADRISKMSGSLVKALLINSTDFSSRGPLLASCLGRGPLVCKTEEGYGKVELANTLPLSNYRVERRSNVTSNVEPISNTPQALLVADELFDGGLRRDAVNPALDGSTTGIGVVEQGSSVSFDVFRRHGADQLRVSMSYYDAPGDLLVNDLNLEVLDGDYGYRTNGICNAGINPEACGNCQAVANVVAAQGSDAPYLTAGDAGTDPYVRYYRGNQFLDHGGQFNLPAECDAVTHVLLPPGPLAAANDFDHANPTESVMLHYIGDILYAGFADPLRSTGSHGAYRIRVKYPVGAANKGAPNTPAIVRNGGNVGAVPVTTAGTCGGGGTCTVGAPALIGLACTIGGVGSETVNGCTSDDTVLTLADGRTVIGTGPNGIAETAPVGADVALIHVRKYGQPFALAVAGPIASDRVNSVISLNRNVYDCSETSLSMRVADLSRCTGASVPVCGTRESTPAANVGTNTKVQVKDATGAVVDEERGFTFLPDSALGGAAASATRPSRDMHYVSNSVPVQNMAARGGQNPVPFNGVVEVSDGWSVTATYDDKTPTNGPVGGAPEPLDAVNVATVNCQPIFGKVMLGGGALPVRGLVGENARRTVITGGCDVGRQVGGRGDFFLDAGETIVYQVGFSNQSTGSPISLKASLSCVDPVPGGVNPCASITILQPDAEQGLQPSGREGIASWTIRVEDSAHTLLGADGAVDLKVCFTSRSTDFAGVLESPAQCFTSREAVQADMEILRYNSDFPGGGVTAQDLNRDGQILVTPAGSQARNRELVTYQALNNAGNPNLAISAMMPWRLDSNNGGFTSFRAAESKPGPANPLVPPNAWSYSTAGGCGWQSQNNGVVSTSGTAPKGVWHAGNGVSTWPAACPAFGVPHDPLTAPFVEYIHDILRSPIFLKVHSELDPTTPDPNDRRDILDARGIAFDLRMESVGWNEEQDYADSGTFVSLEVDNDMDDSKPVILGDSYNYSSAFGTQGPKLNAGDSRRTFGPLRDSDGSIAGKGLVNGDEVGVIGTADTQLVETNFIERPLMAYPVADTDSVTRGFQSNTAIDGATGFPIIPGVCTGSVCVNGADALIGTACGSNAACTGPGTRVGHTTPWGPVRNRELGQGGSFAGGFEDFRGAGGTRFAFEFNWFVTEESNGARGWSIDDPYFEWSEQHPNDQAASSINDCSKLGGQCNGGDGIPGLPNPGTCGGGIGKNDGSACSVNADCVARSGSNPSARQCGTVSFERLYLHACTTGVKVILTDATPATSPGAPGCAAGEVPVNVRSTDEPFGETVCLAPKAGGQFEGSALVSAVNDQKGILFVNSTAGESFNIVVAYKDPECDQDSDGQIGENNLLDLDGDGILNYGADNVVDDISAAFLYAEGQGASDDDNCYDSLLITDITNPVGVPQVDVNGGGTISSEDCPPVSEGQFKVSDPPGVCNSGTLLCTSGPVDQIGTACVIFVGETTRNASCEHHGRSARTLQCDWDNDGFGDICDNCPSVPNNNQLDTDADGVGNVCEDNDIDRDTIPNSSDNCPTLYNPSQASPGGHKTTNKGTVCNDGVDRDNDLIFEVNDNCPNETGGLENGVSAPPITATYNPAQEDTDGDGIGDKCDGEDYDRDTADNIVDNCPTVYNPPDPVFQIQADSDQDGAGDDRSNTDTKPLAQDYCDPDSTDDNNSGSPDDLIQFLAELDCNYTQSGTGKVASLPSVVGSIALQLVTMVDDGSADFTCTSGDPNPYNPSTVVQACAQETTLDVTPGNDASCNTPGPTTPGDYCVALVCAKGSPSKLNLACATDADCRVLNDGHCAATPDGNADPGELSQITLKLANSSVDSLGIARTLTNLAVGVKALTPAVGCVPRGQTSVFTDCAVAPTVLTSIPGGGTAFCTTTGTLNFVVNPANPGPGRSNAVAFAEAGFAITAQADLMEGYAPPQTFKFFADIDRADFPKIPTRCTGGLAGELCEDFDTERNGVGGYQWSRLPLSADPTDTLRANGDLNDDVFGFTMSSGGSPNGTDARTCPKDVVRNLSTCTPVAEENDWHLHAASVEADTLNEPYDGGANNRAGISAPDGGKAHSGLRSMHWGRHTIATDTLGDTSRYRQIAAFVLDSQHTPALANGSPGNDPNIAGLIIGSSSSLEFWHIMSTPDDENAGNGFIPNGQTFGGSQVQVSLLGSNGKFERWQVVTPTVNGYDSIIQNTITICEFDPGDDQLAPDNITMCNRSPMWADIGDVFGLDTSCVNDIDINDPAHKDCGDTSTRGVDFIQNGSVGNGVWAKSVFSLSAFAGRTARLRWIGMQGGGWSFDINRSALEPAPGNLAYEYYDGDDGWYIDDIKVTDLRELGSTIGPDTVTGLTQCTTGNNVANCGTVTPAIANSSALALPTDALGRRLPSGTGTLVPGQLIDLDGRTSAATGPECLNGVLLYQWDEINSGTGAVVDTVQSFSPQGVATVAPGRDTTYRLSVKCSSDTACAATRDVFVATRNLGAVPGTAGDIILEVVTSGAFTSGCVAANNAVLRWPSAAQVAGGENGYDVYSRPVTGMGLQLVTSAAPYVLSSATCYAGGNVAQVLPVGTLITDATADATCPAAGQAIFYQVAHRRASTAVMQLPISIESPCGTGANPLKCGRAYNAPTPCP